MLRAMIFMDHQNFDTSFRRYYKSKSYDIPKLDYSKVFDGIMKRNSRFRSKTILMKSLIFAPKPDKFLMGVDYYANRYKWIKNFNSLPYADLIEGKCVARQTNPDVPMNPFDTSTYYATEKGTDLNLAVHALSKAYSNSYDVAYIMSGDTDYISLYRQLKMIGKIVILVLVEGQSQDKLQHEVDEIITLDGTFFSNCKRYDSNVGK